MKQLKHTPGPWKWQGEDYRGGWGWQLLVGSSGEGIVCGESEDGMPYRHLRAFMSIDPKHCKTKMEADKDSAPAVHVRQADARLIAAAPELLEALKACADVLSVFVQDGTSAQDSVVDKILKQSIEAIAKATGAKL